MKIRSMPPDSRQAARLHSIVSEIVRFADPEKILLLAAGYCYQFTENIFIKNPVQRFSEGYYELLVLIQTTGKISMTEQEIRMASRLANFRNLQLHFRDISEFNRMVEAGAEFENQILLNAMTCYDKR
jgi:hypothetical protein